MDSKIQKLIDKFDVVGKFAKTREDVEAIVTSVFSIWPENELYDEVVDKCCARLNIETEEEPESDFNGYDMFQMENFIDSHDEITIDVLKEALDKYEGLSEFDSNPREFERRLYELAEEYEIEDQIEY
jgi:hypothetical protein